MMSSVCISKCVNDARVPVRATYVNLYKWPESDAEFVRAMSSRSSSQQQPQPRVVDSLSCRQMYLRSYKFSTQQDCDTCSSSSNNDNVSHNKYCFYLFKRNNNNNKKKNKCLFLKKLNHLSLAIFRRCLSCTTTVDVVDHQHH